MQKLLIILSLLFLFALPVLADIPGTNCTAIYRVPEGQPYNYKDSSVPPMWKANRWQCLVGGLSTTNFENSPANGIDTDFQLAVVFVAFPPNAAPIYVYYPILYVDEELLAVLVNDELVPGWDVEQGTGKVTLSLAPGPGDVVTFDIAQVD